MKNALIISLCIFASLICYCTKNNDNNHEKLPKETPFMSVAKLADAEAVLAFDIAKQYIDIEKPHEKNATNKTNEEEWKEKLKRYFKLSREWKTRGVNMVGFYDYDIAEYIDDNNKTAKVTLTYKNNPNKQIIYDLENRNGLWIVIKVNKYGIIDF